MRQFPKDYESFHRSYNKVRMAVLMGFTILAMFGALVAHGHVFDLEIRTPEWDHLESVVKDKENERCFDKYSNDPSSCSEREIERAGTWGEDHYA